MFLDGIDHPLTLKLAIFVGAFLLAASSGLVRSSIAQPLLTSIRNSPGVMHATAAVTAGAGDAGDELGLADRLQVVGAVGPGGGAAEFCALGLLSLVCATKGRRFADT